MAKVFWKLTQRNTTLCPFNPFMAHISKDTFREISKWICRKVHWTLQSQMCKCQKFCLKKISFPQEWIKGDWSRKNWNSLKTPSPKLQTSSTTTKKSFTSDPFVLKQLSKTSPFLLLCWWWFILLPHTIPPTSTLFPIPARNNLFSF